MIIENKTLSKVLDILVPFGPFLRRTEKGKIFNNWTNLLLHVLPLTFFIYWLFYFIPFVGGLIYFLILVPLSARKHIELSKLSNNLEKNKIYLWYLTVVIIGFGGLWSFIGHTFMADSVAMQIGWSTGSPFQIELAFYTLGSGLAGILAIWLRGHMITSLVVTKAVFWYGAAYVHIQDALLNQNYSYLNIGKPLVGDILLPTIFLLLLAQVLKSEME